MNAVPWRSGRWVAQSGGYRAFIPAPLPPHPPLHIDEFLLELLSLADLALGRLDGSTRFLPDPDLFLAMYVRREAVLSSRIEGTRTSLDDLLAFELEPKLRDLPSDAPEVASYIRAMRHGLRRLDTLPLSLRLIREIHAELMSGPHGSGSWPGEFRTSQNWVGPAGAPMSRASFVPPPPGEMWEALDNLEKFMHADLRTPVLLHCGLVHAQFETIHPFIDGNGRVGRLLITLLLCYRGVLQTPLLYLSEFFSRNRSEYYARLQAVHEDGDWEGWLRFFLRGVQATADDAAATAAAINGLRDAHLEVVEALNARLNGVRLLDLLFQQPLVDLSLIVQQLGVTPRTAGKLVDAFQTLGILDEITGRQRSRKYRYTAYLDLFREDVPVVAVEESVPIGAMKRER